MSAPEYSSATEHSLHSGWTAIPVAARFGTRDLSVGPRCNCLAMYNHQLRNLRLIMFFSFFFFLLHMQFHTSNFNEGEGCTHLHARYMSGICPQTVPAEGLVCKQLGMFLSQVFEPAFGERDRTHMGRREREGSISLTTTLCSLQSSE